MSATFSALRAAGVAALVLSVGMVLLIRFAPMRVERWHVDPELAQKQPRHNDWLLRPHGAALNGADGIAGVYGVDSASLTLHLQQTALAEPRTMVLAGDTHLGFITLVQRSKWMGFPDAITIMAQDIGPDRSTLSVWSRSRYGDSDFGVNRARVTRWLDASAIFLIDPPVDPHAASAP